MLERMALEAIDAAALEGLIEASVPEGVTIEFKQESYGRSDGAKRELLKDVSSLANAHGGHLLIGVAEREGAADEIVPFKGDADAELLRLDDILRAGLEPPLLGLRGRAVPVGSGHVLVLRVPRSWNPPHRVRHTGRFYGRSAARAHELGMEELRIHFTQRLTATERARRFVERRRAQVETEAHPVLHGFRGRLVLHVVPLGTPLEGQVVDPVTAQALMQALRPLDLGSGFSWRLNLDGLRIYDGAQPRANYTQLFRTGAVEAVRAPVAGQVQDELLLATDAVVESLVTGVPRILDALAALDVVPPTMIAVALQGVRGAKLGGDAMMRFFSEEEGVEEDVLALPDFVLEGPTERDAVVAELSKALDVLWNALGHARCDLFDDDRRWTGRT